MALELYGDESQNHDNNLPAKVYLKLRHMSGSFFRDASGEAREFRQPLGSLRNFEFNRFAITDTAKCNEEKKKGNSKGNLFSLDVGIIAIFHLFAIGRVLVMEHSSIFFCFAKCPLVEEYVTDDTLLS